MAGGVVRKSGKKNRKHKRSLRAPSNARYKSEQRDILNKMLKLTKHLKKLTKDKQAIEALKSLKALYPVNARKVA